MTMGELLLIETWQTSLFFMRWGLSVSRVSYDKQIFAVLCLLGCSGPQLTRAPLRPTPSLSQQQLIALLHKQKH